MQAGLFFFSDKPEEVEKIDVFSVAGVQHSWMFGSAIRQGERPEQYYVIIGYRDPLNSGVEAHRRFFRSCLYHWFDSEQLLGDILPEIQHRYVVSLTAWHSSVQALRSVHISEPRGNPRRIVLARAMTNRNIGALIRQALAFSDVKVLTPYDTLRFLQRTHNELAESICAVDNERLFKGWPVEFDQTTTSYSPGLGYMAFNTMVLKFVFLECLCNALAYYDQAAKIRVNLEFNTISLAETNDDYANEADRRPVLNLTITNRPEKGLLQDETMFGLQACTAAAQAADGTFRSVPKAASDEWEAVLRLRGYRAPSALMRWLNV